MLLNFGFVTSIFVIIRLWIDFVITWQWPPLGTPLICQNTNGAKMSRNEHEMSTKWELYGHFPSANLSYNTVFEFTQRGISLNHFERYRWNEVSFVWDSLIGNSINDDITRINVMIIGITTWWLVWNKVFEWNADDWNRSSNSKRKISAICSYNQTYEKHLYFESKHIS